MTPPRAALAVSVILAAGVGAGAPLMAQPLSAAPTTQIIIKYREGADLRRGNAPAALARVQALRAVSGEALSYFRPMSGNAHVMRLPAALPAARVEQIAARIAGLSDVAYAEVDHIMHIATVPDDPEYGNQWNLFEPEGINAETAWSMTAGSAGVRVAVLDTGITEHEDLVGRWLGGYDFITNVTRANDGDGRDADPRDPGDWVAPSECFSGSSARDSSWHGTQVAGIVGAAGNNGIGVAGVNWASPVVPVRVLGKCGGFISDIADGMRWAAGLEVAGVPSNPHPARVLNLSLGGSGVCSQSYQDAIDDIAAAGGVIVVAAGNGGNNLDTTSFQPANCSGVITVAATDRGGDRAVYSNLGSVVGISAPGGENVPTDSNGVLTAANTGSTVPVADDYIYSQGTSSAAPQVAGVVSLLLSRRLDLDAEGILGRLQASARPFPPGSGCTTSTCGAGIVDAAAALTTLTAFLDLDADGRTELFWRHSTNGRNVVWLMDGVVRVGAGDLITVADPDWQLAGFGDFDGDGKSDLLWRSQSSGRNVIWFMDGLSRTAAADTRPLNDPLWELAGIEDFDGDGKSDLLWRNTANGRNVIWFLDGATRTGAGDTLGLNHPDWSLAGFGDFNGDGKSDFLWRNTQNGRNVIWLMDGLTRIGHGDTLGLNHPDWFLAGFGDFDGDGNTDLLWRNAVNGRNVMWFMDGATRTGAGDTLGVADPDWSVTGFGDFNGDGRADFLWHNAVNGRNVMWFMDGATRIGAGDTITLPFDPWFLRLE